MKTSHYLLSFSLFTLILLPGCLKTPQYTPRPLTKLTKNSAEYYQTQDNVSVAVKKVSKSDCIDMFGTTLEQWGNPIIPIQVMIINDSPSEWHLSRGCIDLPLVDPEIIKNQLLYSESIAPWLLMGIISCPIALVSGFITLLTLSKGDSESTALFGTITAGATALTLAPLAIGAKYTATQVANAAIESDLQDKALSNAMIPSGATKNTLVFVQKNKLETAFTISLFSKNDSTLDYDVTIEPPANKKDMKLGNQR